MAVRSRDGAAFRRLLQAADIVHLQSQQMPEPVRQEHAGEAGLDGLIGIASDHPRVMQQLGDQPM